MTDIEFVKSIFRRNGKTEALQLQNSSSAMSDTEINDADYAIPDFTEAIKKMNMLDRPIGFVCKSSVGRVVRLIQPYDSNIYKQEPEELEAHWGFAWSQNPEKALPFISLSTSPYNKKDCCTENGAVYCSNIDYNIWSPSAFPQGWEKLYEK